ncbi:MAG: dienelactone hydrolase family protein [Elusimicrobia bacterium]|nr:dienelactone hydrolase family protein [Elusimicrobiota bacterium]MDE2511160.1 dienelactone hydrolase family protein [Elusimicrobiota bacterium]
MTSEKTELEVADGTRMAAHVARPQGGGRRPGLLVIQEAFGVNAHIRDVADRFAREGFTAIAPELYHRTAPGFEGAYGDFPSVAPHYQSVTNETLAADLAAAHAWLVERGGVAEGNVAAIGFCMGGRAAFLAASLLPLKAAVSFYGAGIAPALLDRAPRVRAPLLLVWGGQDAHIPPEQIAALTGALRAAGKPFINAEFSEAGHGFFCDARPAYHAPSAAAAWALALQFLKTRVE